MKMSTEYVEEIVRMEKIRTVLILESNRNSFKMKENLKNISITFRDYCAIHSRLVVYTILDYFSF